MDIKSGFDDAALMRRLNLTDSQYLIYIQL